LKELTFDIFGGLTKQEAIWLESVAGLERARRRMDDIAAQKPGAYFLYDMVSDTIIARTDTARAGRK
jgi:hypothetical protein